MRTHEKWMKMASIYAMCGQHDLALATMKKIEDDEEQLAASKAATRNHDPPKESDQSKETATEDTIPFSASAAGGVPARALLGLCIECKQTPSTHTCRKCKQFVCDPCCYEKRGLELIWWCATCFDDESLTNQQQIREGKYEGDGDNESGDDVE